MLIKVSRSTPQNNSERVASETENKNFDRVDREMPKERYISPDCKVLMI